MITAYKISDKLYRVKNPRGVVKDVWITPSGNIKTPNNQHDILTETEKQAVELLIEKNKK